VRWRSGPDHWGAVTIALHWLTALVVFGLFAMGLWMTELTYYDRWYHDAPYIHKSIGVLLFIVTLLRLLWLLAAGRPQELASYAPWERLAARVTHITLYLLLLAVMLGGYLISTADGRPVEVFGWFEVPATISGLERQEDIAGTVHLILASTLIALALLHAGAALKHHFFDRDRTLRRMLGR
jgi:cytochrome b561